MGNNILTNRNLHEIVYIDPYTSIIRVINGWIYKFYEDFPNAENPDYSTTGLVSTCFVPETKE